MRAGVFVALTLTSVLTIGTGTPASAQMPRNGTQAIGSATPSTASSLPMTTVAPVPSVAPPTASTGASAVPERIAPAGGHAANAGPANATPFSGTPYDLNTSPSGSHTPDLSR
jgi:hypothetical protein